jgi:hypothetical protein
MGHIRFQMVFFLLFAVIRHEQNESSHSASIAGRILSIERDALVHLELDVTLSFDKGSMPWYFSLSACELSEKIGMGVSVDLHALLATVTIALIGVEEAVGSISHHPSSL